MEKLEQKLKEFETKIRTLNDQDLVKQMQSLLEREKRLGDAILLALREIRDRRIDAAMGYGSLFEMLVKYFKLSESSAYTRLQALKLMDAVPGVQDSLVSGELSLSNAALAQQFIQQNEKITSTRYIPVEIRRKVFQRAKGCCEFVGSEGKRCSSQHQLEFDHIIAWSQGGRNDEDSLQMLCRQHNQFRVKETHGFWYQKK